MAKHFLCTACGKCCYGQLPLSWKDARAHVDRFPLGFVWTPVPQGSKDYKLVSELGVRIKIPDRKELAVLIVPTSFIPSTIRCPALRDDNLCGIHETKPLRCKTMPFYPYREEKFQSEVLQPRKDWACDTSENAPVVFQDHKIVDRVDFDAERADLVEQVPILQQYFDYMQKYTPSIVTSLIVASMNQKSGHVVTSLSSFLTATKNPDAKDIARHQLPILRRYETLTASDAKLADFHRYYAGWAKEMAYLSSV